MAGRCASAWASTPGALRTSSTPWSRSACLGATTAATPTPRRPSCFSTGPSLPTSVGSWRWANARLYGFWGSLTEGLRTGAPQNEAKDGENFFEALYADPARLAQFAKAMSAVSGGAAQAIAAKFPWRDHRSVLDIGCAEGVHGDRHRRRRPADHEA